MKFVITGANGHIGKRLIRSLIDRGETDIVALVRSDRAARTLRDEGFDIDVQVVNYADAAGIRAAVGRCDVVFHLIGIIKESKANPFELAHEAACQALRDADLGASTIINLGIVGSDANSPNACLRSRARAESILMTGPSRVICLRVPMVLGEGDYASFALGRNARKSVALTYRAGSMEQPVDCQDVITALLSAAETPLESGVLELAGPESLSRSALIERAGQLLGHQPKVISLPLWLGLVLAAALEKFSSNPPVTRAMLGVLDHDDRVDSREACMALGMSLTPLDETLKRVLIS